MRMFHLVLAAHERLAGDAMAAEITGVPQDGTYSVPLSATGVAPATHFLCSTILRDEWIPYVMNKYALGYFESLRFYQLQTLGGDERLRMAYSNSESAMARRFEVWTLADTLADLELQKVEVTL